MDQQLSLKADIGRWLSSMPLEQIIYLGLFAATWLIGVNVLVALHYKRIGKHWATGLNPFAFRFPFKNFNSSEWGALIVLAVIAIWFAEKGMSVAPAATNIRQLQ